MATILRNSAWHDKPEVKMGDYGEELVRIILEACGFIVYQAVTEGAHLIDFIVELNKNLIFAVDVKTKAMMKKYAETGFDFSQYEKYRKFSQRAHMPVLIIWVDPLNKTIYGNFLHVLDEPRIQNDIKYPKTMPAKFYKQGELIRYYPKCAMLPIGTLTDADADFINKHSIKHY